MIDLSSHVPTSKHTINQTCSQILLVPEAAGFAPGPGPTGPDKDPVNEAGE